jgi:restriction system protein
MAKAAELPKYDDLFRPTLEALTKLGGSGSVEEIDDALVTAIGASQAQLGSEPE